MANIGWGHGRPAEGGTGVEHVLRAYATQGGQLFGARRWPDNPLTLTHVRWQGEGGAMLDAQRDPRRDAALSADEREVWVDLALTFPPSPPMPPGAEQPWMPLTVDQRQAGEWAERIQRAATSRFSSGGYAGPSQPWQQPGARGPASGGPFDPLSGPGPQPGTFSPPEPPLRRGTGPISGHGTHGAPSFPSGGGQAPSNPWHEPSQMTGAWQRESAQLPEVVVLPCIEVELPALIDGQAGAAYRADFARDVAVHFGRAARTIPQVREVRGWMRGDRLILAARAVVGMGNRPPTQAENDGMAQILGQALAQRTLPYARLGFADPSEWMHGAPLPE